MSVGTPFISVWNVHLPILFRKEESRMISMRPDFGRIQVESEGIRSIVRKAWAEKTDEVVKDPFPMRLNAPLTMLRPYVLIDIYINLQK